MSSETDSAGHVGLRPFPSKHAQADCHVIATIQPGRRVHRQPGVQAWDGPGYRWMVAAGKGRPKEGGHDERDSAWGEERTAWWGEDPTTEVVEEIQCEDRVLDQQEGKSSLTWDAPPSCSDAC